MSTQSVLADVAQERRRQRARYGDNATVPIDTGPESQWLKPITNAGAAQIESNLRLEYELNEHATGTTTWVRLIREETAEAFMETDLAKLRTEAVQAAALWVSLIERIDVHLAYGGTSVYY